MGERSRFAGLAGGLFWWAIEPVIRRDLKRQEQAIRAKQRERIERQIAQARHGTQPRTQPRHSSLAAMRHVLPDLPWKAPKPRMRSLGKNVRFYINGRRIHGVKNVRVGLA